MSDPRWISVKNARVHNLRGISCLFPRGRLSAVTGPSGSGKSSLVFDTLWAEAQRRYTESLPPYVRQVLGVWDKPEVQRIEGLSPAVALDARPAGPNPRSTVGTASEISDYLRLLFSRCGIPYCPKCGSVIERTPRAKVIDSILGLPEGTRFLVNSPLGKLSEEAVSRLWASLRGEGFLRVMAGNKLYSLERDSPPAVGGKQVAVVVDRLVVRSGVRQRVAEAVETALIRSGGFVEAVLHDGESFSFSERYRCRKCELTFPDFEPNAFSFNSPKGACPRCGGLGSVVTARKESVIDERLSIAGGAVLPWKARRGKAAVPEDFKGQLESALKHLGASLDTPLGSLSSEAKHTVLYGSAGETPPLEDCGPRFPGVLEMVAKSLSRTRGRHSLYCREVVCPLCKGARLRRESLCVKVGGKNVHEFSTMPLNDLSAFLKSISAPEGLDFVFQPLKEEILRRLGLLCDLGLSYLTLARSVPSLSAGEHQRLRFAMQIGADLAGIVYVLDEPTCGLHPAETDQLLKVFRKLCAKGNSVIIVEHDLKMIRACGYVLELGPGAGAQGGSIVASGTPRQLEDNERSLTGSYLSGKARIEGSERRAGNGVVEVLGARGHNLRGIHVRFPLNVLTCITGVSGSGKSTLVVDTLYRALKQELRGNGAMPCAHEGIRISGELERVAAVDQSPIGRTPRSNPATYTGLFGPIRSFFAKLPLARMRGYRPKRFSFNAKGGRCEVCKGEGVKRVSMQFLPDILVPCESCEGRRFNRETLEVHYRGLSIAGVLELTVDEAADIFSAIPKVAKQLEFLKEIGLGYLTLGQRADTLSGGEAQRIKLSRELGRVSRSTLYVLDEPTTGLHDHDITFLLKALRELISAGNTIVVIEHNVGFINAADYVIDLGPEGGKNGGRVVSAGTPEEVKADRNSLLGRYLPAG